jgi:hypothetical protein
VLAPARRIAILESRIPTAVRFKRGLFSLAPWVLYRGPGQVKDPTLNSRGFSGGTPVGYLLAVRPPWQEWLAVAKVGEPLIATNNSELHLL